jgi:hypothetical protein
MSENKPTPLNARCDRLIRVVLYARVSTNNGQDPELQLRELREYCEHRGWKIIQEYVDTGVSGTKVGLGRLERPTNGLGNRCSILLSYRPGLT